MQEASHPSIGPSILISALTLYAQAEDEPNVKFVAVDLVEASQFVGESTASTA